jgi:GNAT superfamily N-acetyltransferase
MRAREFVKDFEGIDVSLEIQKDDAYVDDDDTDNQVVVVKATSNGKELGHVLFTMSYDSQGMILNPQDLEVDERYRGQGIAQTMYDFVKSRGYRIRRSGQQTDAGAAFWQKHRPGENVWENFADGKVKGKSRPGRVKRAGASCAGSVTDLRRRAKNASGEKAKMYHWCANMKSGKKKNK